jgi:hypothetical protein
VRLRPAVALLAAVISLSCLAGCGGGSAAGPAPAVLPTIRVTPDLQRLLAEPIARPRRCGSRDGVTSGQESPWLGTVDVSIFGKLTDTARQLRAIGAFVRRQPRVQSLYFESRREAYREFQRLYTCSADVRPAEIPASWRVVMAPGTTVAERNALVGTAQRLPGVDVVSCPPTLPCVDIVRSAEPSLTDQPSASPPPHRRAHQ